MTNALIPYTPPRPARLSLDADTWAQIADAYLAGATAPELAAQYHVSITTIHRHIKKRGAGKRSPGATVFARAHAAAARAEADARRRHRISADDLRDLADREPHDPAVLAQVALTASGNAMLASRLGEARALADLALQYGRAAEKRPLSFRSLLLDAILDPRAADALFSNIPGQSSVEQHLKDRYWGVRTKQRIAEDHTRARVAALEARLRALGEAV